MAKRIRRPSPGAIIATLALFLALGGGALAFKGSGTLQKENEIGLPVIPDPPEVVRTIAGIGDLHADCFNDGRPRIDIHNSSGEPLVFRMERDGGLSWNTIEDGEDTANFLESVDQLHNIHISPANGSKRPQATLSVAIDRTGADCSTAQVAVLSVTTEE